MRNSLLSDVTIVIRSVGERTTAWCHHLAAAQVGRESVVVINETPFERALEATFRAGIAAGRRWTVALDADILLRRGAVRRLVDLAEGAHRSTFEVQGRILDKVFGGPRMGGPHVYRTSLLRKAVALCSPIRRRLRPEGWVMDLMVTAGHGWVQGDLLVGVHDFEQYYRDLFRKGIQHAKKHAEHVPFLKAAWRRLMAADPDFRIVSWGVRVGRRDHGPLRLDPRQYVTGFPGRLRRAGLSEKPSLTARPPTAGWVEAVIERHVVPPEFSLVEDALDDEQR